MLGNSWVTDKLPASQEQPSSMELDSSLAPFRYVLEGKYENAELYSFTNTFKQKQAL
jgi:hypothetical protein